jgi:predicted HicB family RNase H-like nuclease
MARYSDAQKEATARYNKKAYDRIDVIVPKGKRQAIKDFAASQGKSLNKFICDAIEQQMGIKLKDSAEND